MTSQVDEAGRACLPLGGCIGAAHVRLLAEVAGLRTQLDDALDREALAVRLVKDGTDRWARLVAAEQDRAAGYASDRDRLADQVAAIRALHVAEDDPMGTLCAHDQFYWPCETSRLVASSPTTPEAPEVSE